MALTIILIPEISLWVRIAHPRAVCKSPHLASRILSFPCRVSRLPGFLDWTRSFPCPGRPPTAATFRAHEGGGLQSGPARAGSAGELGALRPLGVEGRGGDR